MFYGNAELRNYLKTWLHFSAAFYLALHLACCSAQQIYPAIPQGGKEQGQAHFFLPPLSLWNVGH
jgi:hypothetical protein